MEPSYYKRIRYLLLAITMFSSGLGLPETRPESVPIPYEIPHDNHMTRDTSYCCISRPHPIEKASFCIGSDIMKCYCRSPNNPNDIVTIQKACPLFTVCIGSAIIEPGPSDQPRHAKCVSTQTKRYSWFTKVVRNPILLQCCKMMPQFLGQGELAVQVQFSIGVTNPVMPSLAQLYYSGADYPIESIMPDQMDTEYGSFAFTTPFDGTQPLNFCVNTSVNTSISFDLAMLSYPQIGQGVTYHGGNKTYDKLNFNGVIYDVVTTDCQSF